MAASADICVRDRHSLARVNSFDSHIILLRYVEDMGGYVVYPVVLAVLCSKTFTKAGTCLHGLWIMAVNTVDLAHIASASLCLHVFLDIALILMAVCAHGIPSVCVLIPHLVGYSPVLTVGVVAVAAFHDLISVPVFLGLDEISVLLMV